MKICALRVSAAVLLGGFSLAASSASAQVVAFSNFVNSGPSAPYDPSGERITLGDSPVWGIGYRFTSQASGEVLWIDTGLFAQDAAGASIPITWEIRAEQGDRSMGEVMASFTDSLDFPFGPPNRVTPSLPIVLQEGLSYWITASGPSVPGTTPAWFWGDTSEDVQDFFAIRTGPDQWFTIPAVTPQGAYEIVVVPTPGSIVTLIGGGLLLARRRRSR